MSRTTTILALVAVLAIAVSAPAFGAGESLIDRALGLAKSAKKDAGAAKRQAATAKRQANAAKRIASQSWQLARQKAARGPAGPAGPAWRGGAGGRGWRGGDGGRRWRDRPGGARRHRTEGPAGGTGPEGPAGPGAPVAFAQQAASVSTQSAEYVALGGPSVDVDVPPSGLIEVAAQATLPDGSDDGAVALFEDGQLMPGQAIDCGPDGAPALFTLMPMGPEDTIGGTPASQPLCATFGPPAAVRFVTTPGPHTYELRYALCCTGTATFENRRLWVTPLP